MSWNMTNCPDGVPEPPTLAIPSNITVAIVASNGTSNPGFGACCSPNPINIAEGCFAWCEAPPALDSGEDFSNCLTLNENDSRWRHGGLAWRESHGVSATSHTMGLLVLGIWVLSVMALLK